MAYQLGTNVGQKAFADVNHLAGGSSATASASKGKRCTGNMRQRRNCRAAKREQRRASNRSGCRRGGVTRGGYGSAGCPVDDSMA